MIGLYGTGNGCPKCELRTPYETKVCPKCGEPTEEFTWSVNRMGKLEAKRKKNGELVNGFS